MPLDRVIIQKLVVLFLQLSVTRSTLRGSVAIDFRTLTSTAVVLEVHRALGLLLAESIGISLANSYNSS